MSDPFRGYSPEIGDTGSSSASQNRHAMIDDLYPDPSLFPFDVLQRMTAAEKFALCCSLTEAAVNQCRREIEQSHPGITSREVDLQFIEINYGADLAEEVRLYLKERGDG